MAISSPFVHLTTINRYPCSHFFRFTMRVGYKSAILATPACGNFVFYRISSQIFLPRFAHPFPPKVCIISSKCNLKGIATWTDIALCKLFLRINFICIRIWILKINLEYFLRKDVKYLTYAPLHGILYVVVYVTDFPPGIPL